MHAGSRRRDACACGMRSRIVFGPKWLERRITSPVFNPGAIAARHASASSLEKAPYRVLQ